MILIEKLKMRRTAAMFVPRLLTDAQKKNRVTVSQVLFDRSNADENFLKNAITGDETWVYGYDVETKVQSSQCMGKLSPRPKKTKQQSLKREGEVDSFFYSKDIVHYELVPRGETANKELYLHVLKRLREAV